MSTIPKVELRNIKTFPSMSQETLAMHCDLYVGELRLGRVENQGIGGPNMMRLYEAGPEFRQLEQAVYDWCKTLPMFDKYRNERTSFMLNSAFDFWVSHELQVYDLRQQFTRKTRGGKVLMHKPGTDGIYIGATVSPGFEQITIEQAVQMTLAKRA